MKNAILKYQDVALKIQLMIIQQGLAKGTRLANIEDLINQYGVSRSTIMKALDRLERSGVIYQVQGSGIFVRQLKKNDHLNFMESQGFTNDMSKLSGAFVVYHVDTIKPNLYIQEHLQCEAHDDVYYVKRIRYSDGKIYGFEQSYYLKKLVPYLNKEIAEGSIFTYIKDVCGVNVGFSDKYFNVIKLDAKTAGYLDLAENDPALEVEEVFHTTAGEPFDLSRVVYHYENTKFFIQSHLK